MRFMTYPTIAVRAKEEFRLLTGHPWAFSNELVSVPREIPAGSVVTLIREKGGEPIGHALYNPHSLIAARILTRDLSETIDADFFARRISEAASRRELLLTRRNAVRLVHGEADFLPGLLVDKFNDVIAFQIVSAGMEAQKDVIVSVLKEKFFPRAIVEKNNSHLRTLQGLAQHEDLLFGDNAEAEFHDAAGTKFRADILAGQKTGFFLDQMENRTRLRDFIREGDIVLDLFSNEGGFALNAALAGAGKVLAVDISASALARVKSNAELNGIAVETQEADCFDFVRESQPQHDVVVLDPPALTKSKKELPQAKKAYVTLNGNAMRLTKPGGILLTASCSHHLTRELFLDVLWESAKRSRRQIAILEERAAGIDHPTLLAMPEAAYLKVFILRVL
jgi:23S rRNA (cytosine1962-C5)-methyltransferase